jgi:uncharacterized protein YqjF (DUF2071 family)
VAFLTAHWSNLCLLTYAVPPALLLNRVPSGLVLDTRADLGPPCGESAATAGGPAAFVSLVAFDFTDTRVLGVSWPGYRCFPEVNLRFYVRDPATDERGVCFVREFVPWRLVAWIARGLYGEPYVATRMSSCVSQAAGQLIVEHQLKIAGRTNRLSVIASSQTYTPDAAGVEHFFKEHRWGFSCGRRPGTCVRYEVSHPTWTCHRVERYELDWDWGLTYGPEWSILTGVMPCSVVLAQGSRIAVSPKAARARLP